MSVMEKKLSATVQHPAMNQYTGGITKLYRFAVAHNSVMVTDKIVNLIYHLQCMSRLLTVTVLTPSHLA